MAKIFMNLIEYRKIDSDLSSYITLKEYAKKYHYSVDRCRKLIGNGRVDAYRFARKWYILDVAPAKSNLFAV
jgi:hypothetical protein